MEPRIITIPKKMLVGRRLRMSLSVNRTNELWQFLMPRKKEIRNKLNSDLFSVQVFDPDSEEEIWVPVKPVTPNS
ncbi:MAG: hypothetical protein Q8N05_19270 [Bacteroidota bacterium]|nr:hypothetical protein [Bacteroidota bacterium]